MTDQTPTPTLTPPTTPRPALAADPLTILHDLHASELILPDSPSYQSSIQTWAVQKQQHPRLVVRPASLTSLSKLIAHLYTTDLDFAIYGQGFSSASARDVVVNMSAFDDFYFDPAAETVTLGAGQTWGDIYGKLRKVAPGYAVVGARTPSVGIAGTIVSGGFSWLSSEYGCISDEGNMLDARVVKYDGSVLWASSEPELLWALRGGGGGFGVITHVILKAFPYPQDIWAGPILVPRARLDDVASGIAAFLAKPVDPKITMFLYVVKGKVLASILGAKGTTNAEDTDTAREMLVIHAFDARGEDHGRESFAWALRIPGAIDQTCCMPLAEVASLQGPYFFPRFHPPSSSDQNPTYLCSPRYPMVVRAGALTSPLLLYLDAAATVKGTMKQFWAPLLLPSLSSETITRAIAWAAGIQALDASLADCTYVVFEVLSSREPTSISSTAWPRPRTGKHILLLGTGCPGDAGSEEEELARELAVDAPRHVLPRDQEAWVLPSAVEEFHDVRKIYGPHFERLRGLRRRYDPRGRFKGLIRVE
ncbi:FAD-binding oxidoreductase [Aspergillus mulundensis]|uniref:FAD-binding PCMH-type domain-containing protein n=1 Tax=Aspergillus mulundensis TaxID=1810919 RepID=A0A3D8QN27_9EURO|nr:Uncharacterized protein DSM5745_10300 [Aspergillus mulundensis]RDW63189.1 Uncharacterized protein DSM5745_10300 [Aspergillus mulundensis]